MPDQIDWDAPMPDSARRVIQDLATRLDASEAELRASREVIAGTTSALETIAANGASEHYGTLIAKRALAAHSAQEDPDRLANLPQEKAEELTRLIRASHDEIVEERCVICDMGTDIDVHRNLNAKGYHPFALDHPYAAQFDGPVQEGEAE